MNDHASRQPVDHVCGGSRRMPAARRTRTRVPAALVAALVLIATGCGYVKSGRWEDDPKNWTRAFQAQKQRGLKVVHSLYWRAPHWSYEAGYFFELAPNAGLDRECLGSTGLRRLADEDAATAKQDRMGDAPLWFAPRDVTDYEVWVLDDETSDHFMVLIDKTSGGMFLSGYQM